VRFRSGAAAASLVASGIFSAIPALALDKQGSAHGGDVEGPSSGFDFTGAVSLGSALYNPTYAARPNNTGLALFRYAAHADADLIGRRLSIPIDINMLTDRHAKGVRIFQPSELDFITGLTSTWRAGPGALEVGARVETDQPADGTSSYSQSYVDARARYLLSLATVSPSVGKALAGGDVSGWGTLGVFAVNPTYAARPDNSGLALMRYALHVETSIFDKHAAIGLDGTMFTDRKTRPFTPSELDFTPELIGRLSDFELHVAFEHDSPLDRRGTRPGYTQSFLYFLAVWTFDAVENPTEPPPDERARDVKRLNHP
jgi:hypothetical protein